MNIAHINTNMLHKHEESMKSVCPICEELLNQSNLVDVKSVVDDNLYYLSGVRIVNSQVELHCDFEHRFDEEGFTIEKPHRLVAVIEAAFDGFGRCIQFDIREVCSG